MKELVKVDKSTIEGIRNFDSEIRLLELKETLDKLIGKDVYSNNLTDEQIAKLDYILCEIEILLHRNKDIIIQIED